MCLHSRQSAWRCPFKGIWWMWSDSVNVSLSCLNALKCALCSNVWEILVNEINQAKCLWVMWLSMYYYHLPSAYALLSNHSIGNMVALHSWWISTVTEFLIQEQSFWTDSQQEIINDKLYSAQICYLKLMSDIRNKMEIHEFEEKSRSFVEIKTIPFDGDVP